LISILLTTGGDWFESNLIDYDVYSNWVVSLQIEADYLLWA